MAKNKQELTNEATALGIDVAALGEDGKEPSNEAIGAAIAAASAELPVSCGLFLATEQATGNPGINVPIAGLLSAKPDLLNAELPPSGWRAELDKYLKTPTDATTDAIGEAD